MVEIILLSLTIISFQPYKSSTFSQQRKDIIHSELISYIQYDSIVWDLSYCKEEFWWMVPCVFIMTVWMSLLLANSHCRNVKYAIGNYENPEGKRLFTCHIALCSTVPTDLNFVICYWQEVGLDIALKQLCAGIQLKLNSTQVYKMLVFFKNIWYVQLHYVVKILWVVD